MVLIWRGDPQTGEVAGEVDGTGAVFAGRAADGVLVGTVDAEGVVRSGDGRATVGRVDEGGEVWIGEPWQETFLGEVGDDGRVWLGDQSQADLAATCDPPDRGAGAAALLLLRHRQVAPPPARSTAPPTAPPAGPPVGGRPIDFADWAWAQLDEADRQLDLGQSERAGAIAGRVLAGCAPMTGGRAPGSRVDLRIRLAWMKACNLRIEHGPGNQDELVLDMLEEAEILAAEALQEPGYELTRLQLLLNLGLSAGRPDIAEQAVPFLEQLDLDPQWAEHVARVREWVDSVRQVDTSDSAQAAVAAVQSTATAVAELVVAHAEEEERRRRPSKGGGLAEHRRWIEGIQAEEVRQRRELAEALDALTAAVAGARRLAADADPEDRGLLDLAVAHGEHVVGLRGPRLDEHDERIREVQRWLDEHPLF
jgi:hypothetical protein